MTRLLPAAVLTVLVASSVGAQSKGEKYTSEGGRFTVRFPGKPKEATQIAKSGNGYVASGKLTIRGVSRDTQVPLTFRTATEQGQSAGYLAGSTTIHRLDFGVGQGDWKSTEWVANDVKVSYSLRLTASGAP